MGSKLPNVEDALTLLTLSVCTPQSRVLQPAKLMTCDIHAKPTHIACRELLEGRGGETLGTCIDVVERVKVMVFEGVELKLLATVEGAHLINRRRELGQAWESWCRSLLLDLGHLLLQARDCGRSWGWC